MKFVNKPGVDQVEDVEIGNSNKPIHLGEDRVVVTEEDVSYSSEVYSITSTQIFFIQIHMLSLTLRCHRINFFAAKPTGSFFLFSFGCTSSR